MNLDRRFGAQDGAPGDAVDHRDMSTLRHESDSRRIASRIMPYCLAIGQRGAGASRASLLACPAPPFALFYRWPA
uniref:hypothetical protein n=1 Tax=Cupriavidus taiwanensis TaxID=164546 RepID=UPI0011C08261|nr:hypothetical protein [Cupriavidus taiwanensis]